MRSDNIILGKESNIPITSGERIYELGTLGISLMAGTFSEAIKQQIVTIYINIYIHTYIYIYI